MDTKLINHAYDEASKIIEKEKAGHNAKLHECRIKLKRKSLNRRHATRNLIRRVSEASETLNELNSAEFDASL